jgi:hypothetical protein
LLSENAGPYNSWGNGAAMRVSPVGFALDTVDEVLAEAARSAAVTHNHPQGIKGAQATVLAVFLARSGADKTSIKSAIEERFGYDLARSLDTIRPIYDFDVSCQGSVPESLMFLPGVHRLRKRGTQRRLPRRRCRHHGMHRRWYCSGLLRHCRRADCSGVSARSCRRVSWMS